MGTVEMTLNNNKRWAIGLCLGLAALTLAAYWPVFSSEFIHFDDQDYVTENEWVKRGLNWEGARWAFTTGHAANWHPVTWLSHMADVSWYGLKPAGHHTTSVLLHTINAMLVLGLLWQLTGWRWGSGAVAAIFALHPMHVESVAWVSERKDVLSAFFGILTLMAYAHYVHESKIQNPKSKAWYGVALLLFTLGLMSKPMLVTWPCVMLLLDFWPLDRLAKKNWRGLVLEKLPFFALGVASCWVTYLAQEKQGAVAPLGLPLESRLANAGLSYYTYVEKLLWPVKLAFFYPHPATVHPALKDWITPQTSVAILGVLGVSAWVATQRRQRPYLTVGWFLFLGTLVPVIGIVQVGDQAMADRYVYFPMIGITVMVVWGGAEIARKLGVGKAGQIGMLAAGLTAMGWLCERQAAYWKNDETVFGHALAVTENNATAEVNYGAALEFRGKPQEAREHYRSAVAIDPNLVQGRFNLGRALANEGKFSEAEAEYRAAISLRPSYAMAHNNLGTVLESMGKGSEAAEQYETALKEQPGLQPALLNFGRVRAAEGNYGEAIKQYNEALKTDGSLAEAETGIGLALMMQKDFEPAMQHLRRAVELRPASPEAQYQCAIGLTISGKAGEAKRHFQEAIRLRPNWVAALNEYAWLLAAHPEAEVRNGPEAVRLAERARDLSGGTQARIWGTLDAAYGEAGRFPDAINAAEQAQKLASAAGQEDLAQAAEQRLRCYQQGKPYHQGN